ncbi:MAG: hypothetical protein GWP91_20885 [Rhodobacterales bacterium]|nr:hypothetical protein [Rhodobacterales bacterium]
MLDVARLVENLNLSPHPEGGFYREIHRAVQQVQVGNQVRSASSSIYFLLPAGQFSAWHVVRSDEQWHHYAGSPLELHLLTNGTHQVVTIGSDLAQGQLPQAMVPADVIQAARPVGGWALLGCTVAPGFDFADFRMNDRVELTRDYPAHSGIVEAFLRD